jgi:hypothetical protein
MGSRLIAVTEIQPNGWSSTETVMVILDSDDGIGAEWFWRLLPSAEEDEDEDEDDLEADAQEIEISPSPPSTVYGPFESEEAALQDAARTLKGVPLDNESDVSS